jgi:ribosomal protein S18 acetylase RimI-like enzyme
MSDSDTAQIRTYRPGDLPRLQSLTTEAFEPVSIDRNLETLFGEINGRDWKWRKARAVETDCGRDPDGVFVAEMDGLIVGYITTWIDREGGMGMIPNLAVDREVRGRGIGRQLIEHALRRFRNAGLTHARIETLEQNPVGQKLYPSLGFREVARQIHYGMQLNEGGDGEA